MRKSSHNTKLMSDQEDSIENVKGCITKKRKKTKRRKSENKAKQQKSCKKRKLKSAKKSLKKTAKKSTKKKRKLPDEHSECKKKKSKRRKVVAEFELLLDSKNSTDTVCEIKNQLESEQVLRDVRDDLHVKETKQMASKLLEECKQHIDDVVIQGTHTPELCASKCDDFVNKMVQNNVMLDSKVVVCENRKDLMTEPVKRQWEESFLHEPVDGQQPCVKFKLGRCIATEMYSNVHGSDFTLREYFTPRELASRGKTKAKAVECGTTCLLCRRHDVLAAIMVARSKGESISTSVVLPTVSNFVNIKGEYNSENVVYNLPFRYEGLLDPVAAINRTYFEPFMHRGQRWLRQVVPYCKGEGNGASDHHFCPGLC